MSPSESADFITKEAKDVSIDEDAVKKVASELREAFESKSYNVTNWREHPLHPKNADDDALDFIFVMDSFNFSFWTDEEDEATNGKYEVEFGGVSYTGYWALLAAMKRAIEVDDVDITNAKAYSRIDFPTLKRVFRSQTKTEIPMLEERMAILHENGKILLQKFEGKFRNVVAAAEGSALKLLELIVESFPSFRDECTYHGQKVSFMKRAQILVADVWACFEGDRLSHQPVGDELESGVIESTSLMKTGTFHDIDRLTMFADYRVPQILAFFGVMKYSERLVEKLNRNTMFEFGDEMEVEIRGVSIQAVEMIKQEMLKMIQDRGSSDIKINSILIDFYLWDLRRKRCHEIDSAKTPFHRIRSIYY